MSIADGYGNTADLQSRLSALEAEKEQMLLQHHADKELLKAESATLRSDLQHAQEAYQDAAKRLHDAVAKLRDIETNYVVCEREPVGFYRHNPQNLEYGVKWNIEDTLPHGTKLYRPRQEPKEPKE